MSTATLRDADILMRDEVRRQLEWDPEIDATGIGVTAVDGAVTLTGYIDSYAAKLAAERSVKQVRGVRAVANDIEVRLRLERTDADIAADVARALDLYGRTPPSIQAAVHHGHVVLTGAVEWFFQSWDAEKAVGRVRGVRHIVNRITILPRALEGDVRRRIADALRRHADIDTRHITVTVSDESAVLTGSVGSWLQRQAAERAAAAAPGIRRVDNRLIVAPTAVDDDGEIC
jgi:osmotically-inducible protein OsmY